MWKAALIISARTSKANGYSCPLSGREIWELSPDGKTFTTIFTQLAVLAATRTKRTCSKGRIERVLTNFRYFILLPILGILIGPPPSRAQTSVVGAALDGAIVDSTGGRMAGVAVTVREVTTHYAREESSRALREHSKLRSCLRAPMRCPLRNVDSSHTNTLA